MTHTFYKYHGTGNDFILIDNRMGTFQLPAAGIQRLCSRQFGIGADGIITLTAENGYDYRLILYNADGLEGSMCGNGGRCAAAFAYKIGIAGLHQQFMAYDGPHSAEITAHDNEQATVRLGLRDVLNYKRCKSYLLVNTGSPHYVRFVENVENINVEREGSKIRNSRRFAPQGVNVNFVATAGNRIRVRTFERGVEAETLSCGTGVTASALSLAVLLSLDKGPVGIDTRGGTLSVDFTRTDNGFTNIVLEGRAVLAFTGQITI